MSDVGGEWLDRIGEGGRVWEEFEDDFRKSEIIGGDGKIGNCVWDFIRGWGVFYLSGEFGNCFEGGDLGKDGSVWECFE